MRYSAGVAVDRISIALDAALGQAVRTAARRAGMSLSHWIGQAVTDRLRNELLGRALDQWEEENGAFTQEELDEAARSLGAAADSVARGRG